MKCILISISALVLGCRLLTFVISTLMSMKFTWEEEGGIRCVF